MSEEVLTKIVIYHLPDRKKPCLCIEQGGGVAVLASFRDENSEKLFCEFLGGNCMQRDMRRIFDNGGGEE